MSTLPAVTGGEILVQDLLQGADWQANRIKVYRSLGHPTDPQEEAIKSLGHQLDSRYRQVAARLCENEAVELDVSGPKPRLTISPLASLDEPDSLKRLSKMIVIYSLRWI